MNRYNRLLGKQQEPYYGGLYRTQFVRPIYYPEAQPVTNWAIIGLALLLAIAGLTFILGLAFM